MYYFHVSVSNVKVLNYFQEMKNFMNKNFYVREKIFYRYTNLCREENKY